MSKQIINEPVCGISQGVFLEKIHEFKNGFVLTLRNIEFLKNMKLKNQKTQKSGADYAKSYYPLFSSGTEDCCLKDNINYTSITITFGDKIKYP